MGYIEMIRTYVGKTPIILNSSGVILKNPKGDILLENRIDTNNWGLPGGYMELGETFEQTAIRELKEELSITIKNLSLLNIYSGNDFYHVYPNGDIVYSVIALYITDEYDGDIRVDHKEIKDAAFFNINSLPQQLTPITKKLLEN